MLSSVVIAASGEQHNPLIPEPADIIGSLICFVVILFFFWKLVLPRMKKLLDERAEAIEGNIAKADEAQHKAEALLEEYTAQLADACAEAAKIREAARADGQKIVAEAKDAATVEAARVTVAAQAQIEAERQSALVSLRSEVGSLAIDLASGVVGEVLTEDKKAQAMVDRFLADLEAAEKVGTAN
ncbi:ATP synthase F0F1 subunit B [Leifsonia xyli subsp. cynodontis DSM 46306]|jgi:F-type H+-transporting ATPase subunit b|uniref:ATP synthase subunit b n=1 Tax=Leifsonia xyli subsp. cynodontis DSM 46306 TaxID=1389489 RepID=U3P880_LEIXC|nr:F0F1 ATP synthase subunit B [Leifsonia xyli]AGW42016.1 ATP synthase F0F1 subunit B [Leifsonia xyli subsp. cynodontis DSM 46306]